MTDTAQLGLLAKSLRLTNRQRLFAESLAVGNSQRQAAQDAGSRQPDHQGSKWKSMDKVQKYLAALTQTAVVKAERKTGRTVATLSEALIVASDIMRGRLGRFLDEKGDVRLDRVRTAPAGLVKRYETTVRRITGADGTTGIEERKTRLELADALTAAGKLIEFYEPEKNAPDMAVNVVNLPSEMAVQLYRARMRGDIGPLAAKAEPPRPPEGYSK